MTIIDMASARKALNAPDANCIKTDHHGSALYLFTIDYIMDGKSFSFELWATSWEDVEAHVSAIRQSAQLGGKIKAIIPG